MLSVLMITAFLLRVERGGGGLIREGGLSKILTFRWEGGLLERWGLLELLQCLWKIMRHDGFV